MKTLTVRVESLAEVAKSALAALKSGKAEPSAGLSFASYEDMHRVLSPRRLQVIRAMAGAGTLTYREVARRVGRDFKAVHTDLTALVTAGLIDRETDGVLFAYESLHFDFDVRAAA